MESVNQRENIIYNKLVRDKTIEVIESSNRKCNYVYVAPSVRYEMLRVKLFEEVDELACAVQLDSIVEEMADVYEVLGAMLKQLDVPVSRLEEVRKKKTEKYGTYEKFLFLHHVDQPKGYQREPEKF